MIVLVQMVIYAGAHGKARADAHGEDACDLFLFLVLSRITSLYFVFLFLAPLGLSRLVLSCLVVFRTPSFTRGTDQSFYWHRLQPCKPVPLR